MKFTIIEKALAADPSPDTFNTGFLANLFVNKDGSSQIFNELATKIINLMLTIGAAIAIIYFLYSGILFLTAAGNPDAAKKGQQGLMYGAIGIVVIVLARYLVTAVAKFANI